MFRQADARASLLAEANVITDKWHAWHDTACEERDTARAELAKAEARVKAAIDALSDASFGHESRIHSGLRHLRG
jgi:hypothetical protein